MPKHTGSNETRVRDVNLDGNSQEERKSINMELKYKSKESSEQVGSEIHSENIQKRTKTRKNHGGTTKQGARSENHGARMGGNLIE